MENSFHFFPLWKRGMKGDLTAFQKAKLLQDLKLIYEIIKNFDKKTINLSGLPRKIIFHP